ncbi:NADH-quinone oxidoreductase subunit A [Buchnera aphidicola (Thelaxes suberi)]|uniref:NADH-quinone oxidoreductase subunit A n=1 Tax=Buchnera aphidicola TaxID=9 RepID=UPI003464D1E2
MVTNFICTIFSNIHQITFFLYCITAFVLCSIILLISYFLGEQCVSKNKNFPFESGVIGLGTTDLKFSIKFYLIAIFFVLFDVESLYLYTWSICVKSLGLYGLIKTFCFIITLLISLFYLVRNEVFE